MDHFPEGYFYIQSRASLKVVDVDGASLKDDATILLWTPKHNNGFLINKHSGKVVDIRGGPIVEGARIIQYSQKLVADAQNQRWGYNSKEGYIYVLSDPRFVLDVRGMEDGSRLVLHHKKYALDPTNQTQLWDLVPAGKVRAEREVLFETNFL
ncbi:ricin B lectin domain-containing protein [Chlamydoabsidia padenii]|nr:ricin B lectin domain-containing protein [Chlamydoabsidia padenii]